MVHDHAHGLQRLAQLRRAHGSVARRVEVRQGLPQLASGRPPATAPGPRRATGASTSADCFAGEHRGNAGVEERFEVLANHATGTAGHAALVGITQVLLRQPDAVVL